MAKLGQKSVGENPVSKFLERKGAKTDGFRQYRDKENKKNVKFELGEFVVLTTGYTVKGYNAVRERGIYSNEVESMVEPIRVMCEGECLCEGLYKEIKESLTHAGGRLYLAVTVLHNGEVIEFFVKGKAFYNFSELLKEVDHNENKLKFVKAELAKTKAMEFKLPVFEGGSAITEDEMKAGLSALETIEAYRNELKARYSKPTITEETIEEETEDDDLPF